MSEYKIGKVYKIIYIGNENINITYIGSTFNTLRDRYYGHKQIKNGKTAIDYYFKDYGFENFKIFLIKEYKVCDEFHLRMYEQLWMNKMKNCINKIKSFLPLKLVQKHLNEKKYRDNNKDKYIELRKKNKEEMKEYSKKYRELNKDKIKEMKKEYRKNNKDKISEKNKEKVTCECGSVLTQQHLSRHLKSKKHLNFINQ